MEDTENPTDLKNLYSENDLNCSQMKVYYDSSLYVHLIHAYEENFYHKVDMLDCASENLTSQKKNQLPWVPHGGTSI